MPAKATGFNRTSLSSPKTPERLPGYREVHLDLSRRRWQYRRLGSGGLISAPTRRLDRFMQSLDTISTMLRPVIAFF
jgi:hypothetical protein